MDDVNDINMYGDNLGNVAQNDLELNDQEFPDENQQEDEDNDSQSDHRFPYVEDNIWTHWFCKLDGNEFFVEIDEDFIKNKTNLIEIKCKNFIKTLLSTKTKNDN